MKDEVTNGEIFRTVSKIEASVMHLVDEVGQIRIQTTKTNGRVTVLEGLTEKHAKIIETLVNFRWYLLGIGAVVLMLGGLFIKLYIQQSTKEALDASDINDRIQEGITQALDNYK